MMTRLMHLVHEMTRKGIHATKRDLFYADVKLFEKQTNSDGLLEELALMLGCTRHSLMVTASEKGIVIGRVQFQDDGDDIDCTKMGGSGKNIPNSMDRITDIKSLSPPTTPLLLLPAIPRPFNHLLPTLKPFPFPLARRFFPHSLNAFAFFERISLRERR
jgi:hypothetical protein